MVVQLMPGPSAEPQSFRRASELTIASGNIAPTQTYHTVDTEGDAASDNLDTISAGFNGQLLVLRPASDSRTVVLRHNQNAAGGNNILIPGNSNYTMDDIDDMVELLYDSGLDANGAWVVRSTSAVGGGVTDHGALSGLGDDDHGAVYALLAHASRHESGGADVMDITGLTPADHAARHQNGGADEMSVAGLSGALADAQTAASHASSHQSGGGDAMSLAGLALALGDITGYATGTFTPTIQDSSLSDSESQAYGLQVGRYVRLGTICFIQCVVTITDLGTLTTSENAVMAGLPFACLNVEATTGGWPVIWATSLVLGSGENAVTAQFNTQNVSYMNFYNWDSAGGPTAVTVAEVSAGGSLWMTGWYEIEPP